MFTTGEGLLLQDDDVTEDGLQRVFESNVFGHYVLVRETNTLSFLQFWPFKGKKSPVLYIPV